MDETLDEFRYDRFTTLRRSRCQARATPNQGQPNSWNTFARRTLRSPCDFLPTRRSSIRSIRSETRQEFR
ncbi:hypothetical protein RISK_000636 [Rhodopirellula islandica]|uniref:Uncharacterized protein n=1 Tax=Rhodopirellula islandica TaxID=595434 RepID=A0A0J1BM88_RHOIS|nr:hypothetical protein RISK_000636 [Rhodopirellula islandica]